MARFYKNDTNPRQITLVVARYNEALDWLKQVPYNYIVYNKGESNLPKWVANEVRLPNIGFEAYSYLTYIIDNYDNLPDYTIFVQGNPFDHMRELIQAIKSFAGGTDFFPLSDSIRTDSRETLHGMWFELDRVARWLFSENMECFDYPEGAQFIVSKRAILFHSKRTYQEIIDFLTQTDGTIDSKVSGYKVFSAKFPHGGKRLFHSKVTLQEIVDSLADEKYVVDDRGENSSAIMLEILWQTIFDSKHKIVYDINEPR